MDASGTITRQTKEQIREWLTQRRDKPQPLPDPNEIRQQLGWTLYGWIPEPLDQ